MVQDLCQVLKDTYCHVFFNSPTLIQKLHDNGLHGLGIARSERTNMPQMKKDKEMKRRDDKCKFYNHTTCVKWYDNKSVLLLGSHLEEITSISTVQRKLKCSSSKIAVNCPNSIKLYNSKMSGVHLTDQLKSAYKLDRRSKCRFYLRLLFDLFDVALVNSFIVYKKLENKDLTLKEFKIRIALELIASVVSRKPSSIPAHQSLQYLRHICQFSWRQDDNVLYAPKQEKRTEHLLRVHYVM